MSSQYRQLVNVLFTYLEGQCLIFKIAVPVEHQQLIDPTNQSTHSTE